MTQSDSLAVMNSLQMVLKGAQRGHTTSPPTLPAAVVPLPHPNRSHPFVRGTCPPVAIQEVKGHQSCEFRYRL